MELINLHAFQVLKLLNNNEITSVDYVTELLKHINKREPLIGAWNYLNEDLILNSAKKLDEKRKISTGENIFGLPIGIKDIIDTYDMPTENGSKICIGRQPSKDAHLVKLLRKEGLIIFGKTVTTEFALSAPGKTKNPKDLECTPGGSSSGSAAAVGDNMIPLSIGSQTGGSVLRPASFNGIIGFKPTFGTISRTGMSPVSFRLDQK
jgi:Asp-tRNA(Asn)/Glu-tRNA(Gln) amidotransferase A subunit family amidase